MPSFPFPSTLAELRALPRDMDVGNSRDSSAHVPYLIFEPTDTVACLFVIVGKPEGVVKRANLSPALGAGGVSSTWVLRVQNVSILEQSVWEWQALPGPLTDTYTVVWDLAYHVPGGRVARVTA